VLLATIAVDPKATLASTSSATPNKASMLVWVNSTCDPAKPFSIRIFGVSAPINCWYARSNDHC